MKKAYKNKKHPMKLLCCSAVLVLMGCQSAPKPPTDVIQALDQAIAQVKPLQAVPSSVRQELMQKETQQARRGLLAEKRLEIAASGVAAAQFLAAIVDDSPYSIAVHPDVSGTITLSLKNVTLDETLDVIESLYGYDIRREGRVITVYPAGMRTETIPLDYLYIKRSGISSTSVNSGGVSGNDSSGGNGNSSNSGSNSSNNGGNSSNQNVGTSSGVNIYTENESDFWSELKVTLSALVGSENGRSVIVSPQAGLITIKAMPAEITAVKRFIASTEEHLRRQVIIEAKIMEVTLNDDYQQGVKWDQVLGNVESTSIDFSTTGNIAGNTIASAIGGVTNLSFLNKDFGGVIELLSTQGNVQVLSSPRITATNNQKAIIKVGEDEYFVTDVSSTTTTGTSTTTTPEIDLTPFFSGIALDVTPQIDANGEVILHVHPSVTITDEQTKTIRLSEQDIILPLAQSSVRESDTIIRAKSGEIVVIGGLIETRKVDLESKTPFFGNIPIVGALFKSKSESVQKKELVILLKPIVIGQDTWKNQLQDARALLKQWFPEDADAVSN
ncbi:MAG: MSHA biogenesis protein MshL [Cognaticolwellia sp.]|jgi:MSHA biogenesis protein MshL